jgi:hypothetical protein
MDSDRNRFSESVQESPSPGAEVLKSIEGRELTLLINKLVIFASHSYFGPLRYEDLVMQALADVWLGKRSLNLDYPLFKNLCLIVKSIAWNQLQKEKRYVSVEGLPEPSSEGLTPVELYEQRVYVQSLRDLIDKVTDDDGRLNEIVEFVLDKGEWKTRMISQALNIELRLVRNAKKLMKRRLVILTK